MSVCVLVMLAVAVEAAAAAAAAAPAVEGDRPRPLTNCTRRCGDIDVPYPFGIADGVGDGCYLHPDMALTCDTSATPPRLHVNSTMQVTGITLSTGQLRGLLPMSYSCFDLVGHPAGEATQTVALAGTYSFSYTANQFVSVGCETMAHIVIGRGNYGCCVTMCAADLHGAADGECVGVGCCSNSIPKGLRSYNTLFFARFNGSETYKFNNCSYAFLVEKNQYTFQLSDLASMDRGKLFPVVADWSVGRRRCAEAARSNVSGDYACASTNSECVDSENGEGYICKCAKGFAGNPYLHDGCEDINECSLGDVYPCKGICSNTPGSYECSCPDGLYSNDPKMETCMRSSTARTVKMIIGIAAGLLGAITLLSMTYFHVQKKKIQKLRDQYFEQNGGQFLRKTLAMHRITTFRIFTMADLELATDGFRRDRVLGRGGFGTVYGGRLPDGTAVAIKRSSATDDRRSREFANEMLIISQINHRNIVKLLGCCLEAETPVLVYEYVPNGTLFALLHERRAPVPFARRLQLAREAAGALKYLHSDALPPILHGDVKSSNILLDDRGAAKVSDFGTSVLAPRDGLARFTTMVQGTYGYLDPQYMRTSTLTDKSDVYSFGVVLMELLTRRPPLEMEAPEHERCLAFAFASAVAEGRLSGILDPEIAGEDGMVEEDMAAMAGIAARCVSLRREERPSMKEVAAELGKLGVRGDDRRSWPDEEAAGPAASFDCRRYDVSAVISIECGR